MLRLCLLVIVICTATHAILLGNAVEIRSMRNRRASGKDSMTGYGDEPNTPEQSCATMTCNEDQKCVQEGKSARCEDMGGVDFTPLECEDNEVVDQCGSLCEEKCSQLGKGPMLCPEICLPPACVCKDNYYRNRAGKCVPLQSCDCGPNEMVDECGNSCEPTCENAYGKARVCPLICEQPACVCRMNYYRKDGKCVPQRECAPSMEGGGNMTSETQTSATSPMDQAKSMTKQQSEDETDELMSFVLGPTRMPNIQCGANETVNECGNLCEQKCEDIGEGPIACPAICGEPACVCKEGYFRDNDGNCVTVRDCSLDCDRHEEVNLCGSRCEPTCENAFGKPKACVKICDPPACVCKSDYYRKDGKCVRQSKCSQQKSEEDDIIIRTVGPQQSQRKFMGSMEMVSAPIQASQAFGGTSSGRSGSSNQSCGMNEELNQCGNGCEGKCEEIQKGPSGCAAVCLPPACACKKGYYRNEEGKCVERSSCPSDCGVNEELDQCGNLCEEKCEDIGNGPIVCPLICAEPACTCQKGYYRNKSGNCVQARQCY